MRCSASILVMKSKKPSTVPSWDIPRVLTQKLRSIAAPGSEVKKITWR